MHTRLVYQGRSTKVITINLSAKARTQRAERRLFHRKPGGEREKGGKESGRRLERSRAPSASRAATAGHTDQGPARAAAQQNNKRSTLHGGARDRRGARRHRPNTTFLWFKQTGYSKTRVAALRCRRTRPRRRTRCRGARARARPWWAAASAARRSAPRTAATAGRRAVRAARA